MSGQVSESPYKGSRTRFCLPVRVSAFLIGSRVLMHKDQNTALGSNSNVQGHLQCFQSCTMSSTLSFFLHTGLFFPLYPLIVRARPLYPNTNVRKMSHLLFSRRLSQQFDSCISVYLFVNQSIVCHSLRIKFNFSLHGISV